MSDYSPATWNPGDTITATKLNNMETGIDSAHSELDTHSVNASHPGGIIYSYKNIGGAF